MANIRCEASALGVQDLVFGQAWSSTCGTSKVWPDTKAQ